METEQVVTSAGGRLAHRSGRLVISMEKDIPLLELVRDCTYITRPQIEQLVRQQESYRNRSRRLSRLVEIAHLATHGQETPYSGNVYSIARRGLAVLEVIGKGLFSVTSETEVLSNDLQIAHYLGINKTRLQLLETFHIRKWWSDRVLQSLNIATNSPTVKDYDAIIDVSISQDRVIKLGFEYELTMKSRDRYAEIRRLLEREEGVSGVLYVTESEQTAVVLSGLVYSQRCPVAITTTSQIEVNRASAEVFTASGGKVVRSNLNSFLSILK